jgi:hypothetical protein
MGKTTTSRRAYIKAVSVGTIGAALSLASLRGARAESKATPAQAGYVDHPASDGSKCSTCANYIPTGSMCEQVAGVVSPNGFCNYYTPKG